MKQGAHLTKPGWSKPHTHSNPTNLALFKHKITLYRFNQGAHTIAGGLKWEQGAEPTPETPPNPLTLTTDPNPILTLTRTFFFERKQKRHRNISQNRVIFTGYLLKGTGLGLRQADNPELEVFLIRYTYFDDVIRMCQSLILAVLLTF